MVEKILNIKQKKRKRKSKKTIPASIRREADPDYVTPSKPWEGTSAMTEKEYSDLKKRVSKYILRRKKRSPRFNKYKNKTIVETMYRLYYGKTKICTHCKRELGTTFFDKQKDKRHSDTYRRPYCIDCRKKKNHEDYLRRKEAGYYDT